MDKAIIDEVTEFMNNSLKDNDWQNAKLLILVDGEEVEAMTKFVAFVMTAKLYEVFVQEVAKDIKAVHAIRESVSIYISSPEEHTTSSKSKFDNVLDLKTQEETKDTQEEETLELTIVLSGGKTMLFKEVEDIRVLEDNTLSFYYRSASTGKLRHASFYKKDIAGTLM